MLRRLALTSEQCLARFWRPRLTWPVGIPHFRLERTCADRRACLYSRQNWLPCLLWERHLRADARERGALSSSNSDRYVPLSLTAMDKTILSTPVSMNV